MGKSTTLIGIFLDTVAAHPKPDLFMRHTAAGWESISADRARSDVECFSLALEGLGVRGGDRVALLSENRYEWPIVDLACLGLGAVTVPIYPTLTAPQCRLILANSEAKVVVVSSAAQLAKIREIATSLPALEAVVQIDPGPLAGEREHGYDVLLARGLETRRSDPGRFERRARSVQAEDLATIIYTSGTTGDPKGAMLLHRNIASNVHACLEVVSIGPEDRCLSFLPLCHIFERMAGLYAMLAAGATIAYAQSLDTVAADAVEVRPTILCGVPRFYEKVYARVMEKVAHDPPLRRRIFHWGLAQGLERARAHFEGRVHDTLGTRLADRLVGHKVRERVGGRLRFCISGGAALAPKVMEFFFAVGIPIVEGYGLTETSPVICLNPPGRERPGSVGRPIPGVEVKIGPEGEILTRGPHIMLGYFRNPAATEAAIRDGWFHTGDVGRLDEDGYVHITDRLKDLIVTAGGKKVAPQPIEARLKTSKWVSEAVLLGDGRPYVVCLIVPNRANLESEAASRGWSHRDLADLLARPEVRALYQAEIDRVNRDLAPFETIKRFDLIDRELSQEAGELTPTLKVKRRVVLGRFEAMVEKLYVGHQMPGAA
jgi:long-chain acyl-CoA synthetase